MDELGVGRIVHYVPRDDEGITDKNGPIVALVVRVFKFGESDKNPNGEANLQLFPDGTNDNPAGVSTWRTSILFDVDGKPGTWHWPPTTKPKAVTEGVTHKPLHYTEYESRINGLEAEKIVLEADKSALLQKSQEFFKAVQFLEWLRDGGSIVSSNDCSPGEITAARAFGRFHVDESGFGYLYRPKPDATAVGA